MNAHLVYFEKYSTAPSPNRDYYGIKVFADKVILYQWKISHGPHLLPLVRVVKFSEFSKDKAIKELIEHVFGTNVLRYLQLFILNGPNTLLTLPKVIIGELVKYLNLQDITVLLRASPVCSEVFDTKAVWKTLHGRAIGSISTLPEMEKEVVANRGFKKLLKEQHARFTAKKSIKLMDDKPMRMQNATGKTDKVVRSASVNIPKTTLPDDTKNPTEKRVARKLQKPTKSMIKSFDLPKKSASEAISTMAVADTKFGEKNVAVQGHQSYKSSKKTVAQEQLAMNKFQFVNEDRQKTELMLPYKFFKKALVEADSSDNGLQDDLLKSKSMTLDSPKKSLAKRSSHALGDGKVQAKPSKSNKSTGLSSKVVERSANVATKSARNDERSDDSDESGMSFLMKRYLEASNEVAKKFSECQNLAVSTKSSGVQVDLSAKANRKPAKKMQKYAPFLERSTNRKKF